MAMKWADKLDEGNAELQTDDGGADGTEGGFDGQTGKSVPTGQGEPPGRGRAQRNKTPCVGNPAQGVCYKDGW